VQRFVIVVHGVQGCCADHVFLLGLRGLQTLEIVDLVHWHVIDVRQMGGVLLDGLVHTDEWRVNNHIVFDASGKFH